MVEGVEVEALLQISFYALTTSTQPLKPFTRKGDRVSADMPHSSVTNSSPPLLCQRNFKYLGKGAQKIAFFVQFYKL